MKRAIRWSVVILALGIFCAAAHAANYDESKVPDYTLPDPLVMSNGEQVKTADTWRKKRRPEVLDLFQKYVYGKAPGRPAYLRFEVTEMSDDALDGLATRKQVSIYFTEDKERPRMDLLIYLPNDVERPVPCFIGLNFSGNHSIENDPAIKLTDQWMRNRKGTKNHRATEEARGTSDSRWPVKEIMKRGYGVATAYYGDIDPDYDDGFQNGIHSLYYEPGEKPAPDEWGSIGAWAWGLSRGLDYLEHDEDVNGDRVFVMGHSRLGKTALWAGARDPRFALVISNCSGCGGAALSRRAYGETVARINKSFPHWFCDNFNKFNDNEEELPVDQHMLIALSAPRPTLVCSAKKDGWADPRGEFLATKHASPVFELLGAEGLPLDEMPELGRLPKSTVSYRIRAGGHDVKLQDWHAYMDFADYHYGE